MKVKALVECIDKENGKRYPCGDVFELSEDRVKAAPAGVLLVLDDAGEEKPKKRTRATKKA